MAIIPPEEAQRLLALNASADNVEIQPPSDLKVPVTPAATPAPAPTTTQVEAPAPTVAPTAGPAPAPQVQVPVATTTSTSAPVAAPVPISPAVYYNQKADEIDRQAMSDWQNMLSNARKSIEQERTDNIKMAKFAALGNVLRTMVQPLGWAIGGGRGVTGNVQVPDNREYLAAFNRAIKAGEDLRNIDMRGADLQLRYSQQMAQNARNISNLYMRYGMSHGTSAGVDMDKVYQDRITSALNQYVKDKNNWHAGAKPVAPTFDEHLRQIGLRWFGLEDSPEALAALEKIGEEAENGIVSSSGNGNGDGKDETDKVETDPRDTNKDGKVSLLERGKNAISTYRDKRLQEKARRALEAQQAAAKAAEQGATAPVAQSPITNIQDAKRAGDAAYGRWKNGGTVPAVNGAITQPAVAGAQKSILNDDSHWKN